MNLVILGAGAGGTAVANRLRSRLPPHWELTVVDPEPWHLYQPDLLFMPFGVRVENRMRRAREKTLRRGLRWIQKRVDRVDPDQRRVVLHNGGSTLRYDLLVLASGSEIAPEQTEGLAGRYWHQNIYDFYTPAGAARLRSALGAFPGGKLLVNIAAEPIKAPSAPLEFLFLAEEYFSRRGIRDSVDLRLATPLSGAFSRPEASRILEEMLQRKGIGLETRFRTARIDPKARTVSSEDDRELSYDLLVTIPSHRGALFVGDSGMGDRSGFVPTHSDTLLAEKHSNVFVLGDATDLPTLKAGSVAHYQSQVVAENLLRAVHGKSLTATFDGHASYLIESGYGKAVLVDFNYDVEPLPGHYPVPGLGPFTLLGETRRNHWGKLGARWLYWNAILPGRPVPLSGHLSMMGKRCTASPSLAA